MLILEILLGYNTVRKPPKFSFSLGVSMEDGLKGAAWRSGTLFWVVSGVYGGLGWTTTFFSIIYVNLSV